MRRITNFGVLVLITAVTACSGSGDDTTRVGTRSLPTGAEDVVIRIDTRGGFTSADYQLGIVPQLTVFGDGRVVVAGPVTEQYPPHALPNLLTGSLDRATVERLATRASELDLFRHHDYGQPGVSDLPTTEVSLASSSCAKGAACTAVSRQRTYALDWPVRGDDPGVSTEQRAARRNLRTFVRYATTLAGRVATEPYRATEVAVSVRPATGDTAIAPDGDPGRIDWPLGDLATFGSPSPDGPTVNPVYRCAVLTGPDAATALAAAAAASSITRWRSGGVDHVVVFRPLLPDEHACP